MKKTFLLITTAILSALVSCTTDTFETDESLLTKPKEHVNGLHKITESDALGIAGKFFTKTRSTGDYSVEYILNDEKQKTHNVSIPDTLAYIFNFGDDNGFAIIASDNRVFPLLAYSETGHLKYNKSYDDPVYANFISKVGDYMATIDENDTTVVIPDDYTSSCAVKTTPLKTKYWKQFDPFDKYVAQEHPGSPVGCVAIAAGQIMMSCKNEFYYHGIMFNCKAIREAIDTSKVVLQPDNGDDTEVTYTYDEATDKAAKFLYFLCEDLNMTYSPGESSARSEDAFYLLKELGFLVNESSMQKFSDEKVSDLLEKNCYIYVDGRSVNNQLRGHAWVIDGYSFCWKDIEKTEKTDIFFHCDWGWGGEDNGYYSSDMFNTRWGNFNNMTYFSVIKKMILIPEHIIHRTPALME